MEAFFLALNARNAAAIAAAELRAANQHLVMQVEPEAGAYRKRKRKPNEPPSAVWPDAKDCCKRGCCKLYTPDHLNKLRARSARYWFDDGGSVQTNQSANRKAFTRSRVRGPSAHDKRDGAYRLDLPGLLTMKNYDVPLDAREHQSRPVCAGFYHWATGQSKKFVTNFNTDRAAGSRLSATKPGKTFEIHQWLEALGHEYQHSPDSDLIMLPFVDKW